MLMTDEMFKYNDSYFSICIPHYCRAYYLYEVIESLHKYADMPYELIIHEDGSTDNSLKDIIKLRNEFSTIIINTNTGYNMGLAHSINRCVSMATSKYILFLNNDCRLLTSCLKDFKNILDNEFVGFIAPSDEHLKFPQEYFETNNTKFYIHTGFGSGAALAFRKKVWEEVGGFELYQSACTDTSFIYKTWRHGYFRGCLVGQRPIENMSQNRHGSKDTSIVYSTDVCCLPKLFNESLFVYRNMCVDRTKSCWDRCKNDQPIPGSTGNIDYWSLYTVNLFKDDEKKISGMDWELAKKHGQDKWKDVLLNNVRIKNDQC